MKRFAFAFCLVSIPISLVGQTGPEVAAGLRVPGTAMPYALDSFAGKPELIPIQHSNVSGNNHAGTNVAGQLAGSFFYKPKGATELRLGRPMMHVADESVLRARRRPDASRIEIEREAQKLLGMLELGFADAKTLRDARSGRARAPPRACARRSRRCAIRTSASSPSCGRATRRRCDDRRDARNAPGRRRPPPPLGGRERFAEVRSPRPEAR